MQMPGIRTLALAAALLAPAAAPGQGFDWDRYRPGTLAQVMEAHRELPADGTGGEPRTWLTGENFPTRARVVFTGRARPLTPIKRAVIERWVADFRLPANVPDYFREEHLFLEEGVEHWLPVQAQVAEHFGKELRPGDAVDLFTIWIGARREGGSLEWVFLVNEFQSVDAAGS